MTISATIGVGGDYANIKLALDAMFFGADPGDNFEFDIISSINEPPTYGPNFIKVWNRTITIKCSNNELYKDDHTKWFEVIHTLGPATYNAQWANTYGFTLTFSYIKFLFLAPGNINHIIQGELQPGTPGTEIVNINVNKCIFGWSGTPAGIKTAISGGSTGIKTTVTDCLFDRINYPFVAWGDYSNNFQHIERCTIYNATIGVKLGTGADWTKTIIRSVYSNAVTSGIDAASLTNATILNSAVSDNSLNGFGVDCKVNIDASLQFQSTDFTSVNFLKLIDGTRVGSTYTAGAPDLGKAGIVQTYADATDIEGNTRPGDDAAYSIGSYEQQYAFGGYNVKMIQDKIVITHSRHNEFSIGLNFALDK